MTPRTLSNNESLELENRNPDLHQKILAHNNLVRSGKWDQLNLAGFLESIPVVGEFFGTRESLPIPARGLAFTDPVYGGVVVFPDAAGVLHFTGDVPAAVVTEVQKPTFRSPAGNGYEDYLQKLQDMTKALTDTIAKILLLAPYLVAGAAIVLVIVLVAELRQAV